MNVVCERCSALFETSTDRPSRYCTSCRELLRAEKEDATYPTHAISDRPTAPSRYLDDPYDGDDADISLGAIRPTAEEQRLADSGAFGLILGGWLVVISSVLNGVLGFFNLAEVMGAEFQNVPAEAQRGMVVGLIVGIGCVAVLTLIPTVFMIVGGASLRRFSSRGLVITGVVFTFLMVAWYGFSLVVAVIGSTLGNDGMNQLSTATIIRAVILHVLEVICIVYWVIAAVRALRIMNRPEISRLFDAKAYGSFNPRR